MSYPDFIQRLKDLNIKKKCQRPKISPNKFYPHKVEAQVVELLREELENYCGRLQSAAMVGLSNDGVEEVVNTLGGVPDGFRERVEQLANEISNFNGLAFADFSELTIGEKYFPSAESQMEVINAWSENFVNLCKSANEEVRKKVAGKISDGVLAGRSPREIRNDVGTLCRNFADSKADLIAVTEVAKLNTAIQRCQCLDAGIEYYTWSAAMDGRTRTSHALMNDKICKWGDNDHYYVWKTVNGKRSPEPEKRPTGAYIGEPGTDFRCRCVAIPYDPRYEDDYEQEREKGEQRGVIQSAENPQPVKGKFLKMYERELFEGKRTQLYSGEEKLAGKEKYDYRITREQERLEYLKMVMSDYDFVAKRPYDNNLQENWDLYAVDGGSTDINAYLRGLARGTITEKDTVFNGIVKSMAKYIQKTPMQRNLTLYRYTSLDKDIIDKWIATNKVSDTGFMSFSTSEQHSKTFLKDYQPGLVDVKIIFRAKKGDKVVAPPYRVLNGVFIGYAEESEFTALPGELIITEKKYVDKDKLYIFKVRYGK